MIFQNGDIQSALFGNGFQVDIYDSRNTAANG